MCCNITKLCWYLGRHKFNNTSIYCFDITLAVTSLFSSIELLSKNSLTPYTLYRLGLFILDFEVLLYMAPKIRIIGIWDLKISWTTHVDCLYQSIDLCGYTSYEWNDVHHRRYVVISWGNVTGVAVNFARIYVDRSSKMACMHTFINFVWSKFSLSSLFN
jgi:hypothetical protein